ncbi:MAG: CoA transferase, partial [Deltaproteobacteria bacterium]
FTVLARPEWESNEGRRAGGDELHDAIEAITSRMKSKELASVCERAGIPHAPISTIDRVMELEDIKRHLLRTETPGGTRVRLPPAAVDTEHLESSGGRLPFCPAYGEHTEAICRETGLDDGEIEKLREGGVIA